MATPATGGAPRQGILSLAIKDKGALFNAYMPFVKGGGLFVPTAKRYSLGDEVFILLSLMEEKDRLPVAGKVVWITPAGAQGNRTGRHRRAVQRFVGRRGGAHEDRVDSRGHPDAGTADAYDVSGIHGGVPSSACRHLLPQAGEFRFRFHSAVCPACG